MLRKRKIFLENKSLTLKKLYLLGGPESNVVSVMSIFVYQLSAHCVFHSCAKDILKIK